MEYLNSESFLEAAGALAHMKLYPYFDIAYYALNCMAVRDDLASGATLFSRKHPLSCWFSSMILCFAGVILSNFLLGESVVAPFKRTDDILLATVVWYMVFYSPFDLCSTLIKFFPIKCVLSVMKEIQRAHKVHIGVAHAAKLMPNAWFVMVLVGTAKGAGSGILRTFEQMIRGVWIPTGNEFLRPTFYTKACILASAVFALDKTFDWIEIPDELVYLCVVAFFVYFKLSSLLLGIHDPFLPFENLFCALFMGGIWDALSRAMSASKERRAAGASASAESDEKKDQ